MVPSQTDGLPIPNRAGEQAPCVSGYPDIWVAIWIAEGEKARAGKGGVSPSFEPAQPLRLIGPRVTGGRAGQGRGPVNAVDVVCLAML